MSMFNVRATLIHLFIFKSDGVTPPHRPPVVTVGHCCFVKTTTNDTTKRVFEIVSHKSSSSL